MSDLISIILPVYNGEQFLEESIDSIINQTYSNWELWLLDDCSTDNTPGICLEYEKKDSRIHYYRNEKNLRLPGNLNKGFSLANGDYLTWTSDDNRFRPQALEKMHSALVKNEADLVYAGYQIIDENGRYGEIINSDPKTKEHILGSNVVGACFLYTRSAANDTGEYDTELMLVEDFDYWQRMIADHRVIVLDEVLYDYRWHAGSLTSTKKQNEFGKVLEAMLRKNVGLYKPLTVEQKRFYYDCLRRSYIAQGFKFKGSVQKLFFSYLGKILVKLKSKGNDR